MLELLVVMVIIGLLASYVAPKFFDQVGKSEIKAARAQLNEDEFERARQEGRAMSMDQAIEYALGGAVGD